MTSFKNKILKGASLTILLISSTLAGENEGNCNFKIKKYQKIYDSEDITYKDLNVDQKKSFNNCIKTYKDEPKSSLEIKFHPILNTPKSLKSDTIKNTGKYFDSNKESYSEKIFKAEDLKKEIEALQNSHLIASVVDISDVVKNIRVRKQGFRATVDLIEAIDIIHAEKIDRMNNKEATRFVFNEMVYKIRREMEVKRSRIVNDPNIEYKGEIITDANLVCKVLGFDKAKESIMSKNIIPARSYRAKYMRTLDLSFWSFGDINEINSTIHQEELRKDKEKWETTGYRFFEEITCVNLGSSPTDYESELFEEIEYILPDVASWQYESDLMYESDPLYDETVNNEGRSLNNIKKFKNDSQEEVVTNRVRAVRQI